MVDGVSTGGSRDAVEIPRQGMRKLFERTVRTAVRMKLVIGTGGGTKVGAAARERTYDAEGLGKLLERLEGAIRELARTGRR